MHFPSRLPAILIRFDPTLYAPFSPLRAANRILTTISHLRTPNRDKHLCRDRGGSRTTLDLARCFGGAGPLQIYKPRVSYLVHFQFAHEAACFMPWTVMVLS